MAEEDEQGQLTEEQLANRFTENDFEILASTVAGLVITTEIRLSETSLADPFRARIAIHCLFYVQVLLASIDRALIAMGATSPNDEEEDGEGGTEQTLPENPELTTHSAWRRLLPQLPAGLKQITALFNPISQAGREEREAQAEERKKKGRVQKTPVVRESTVNLKKRLSERYKEMDTAPRGKNLTRREDWRFSLSSVPGREDQEEKEEEEEDDRLKVEYAKRMYAGRRSFARQRGNLRHTKVFKGFRNQPQRKGRAEKMYVALKNKMKYKDIDGVLRKHRLVDRLGVLTAFLERLRVNLTRTVRAYYIPRLGNRVHFTIQQRVDEFMDAGHTASENLTDAVEQFESLLDYIHAWEEFHNEFPNRNMNDLSGYFFFLQVFMSFRKFLVFDPFEAGFLEYDGQWNVDVEFGYPEDDDDDDAVET